MERIEGNLFYRRISFRNRAGLFPVDPRVKEFFSAHLQTEPIEGVRRTSRPGAPWRLISRKGRRSGSGRIARHATAIEADEHLHRCMVYIDLNMVRAGVVNHPGQWNESGFTEIQKPPKRYGIIDLQSLSESSGFAALRDFQTAHRQWVEQGLEDGLGFRDDRWSESIAIGTRSFVEKLKNELGCKAAQRDVIEGDGSYVLRGACGSLRAKFAAESEALRSQNTFFWNEIVDEATT